MFQQAATTTTTATRTSEARRHRARRGIRRALIALGMLVGLLAAAAGIAYALLSNAYDDIARITAVDPELARPEPSTAPPGEKAPVNILLIGSDDRESTASGTGTDDLRGFRSDTIMVAQISPDREHVTVMSIMRDNWVTIPGYGEAKINAAFSYGGGPLAVNTVEQFIGARIDHLALVDFESFSGLTDAVGGVTVENELAFTALHGEQDFAAGSIELHGDDALSFVRERYAFADGDYQRVRNQQAYLAGVLKQVLSRETLSNPDRVLALFRALQPYLIVDDDLTLTNAVGLGYDLRGLRSDGVSFFTSPTIGVGTSADGQSIVIPDEEALQEVRAAFHDGTLHEYAARLP